MCRGGGLYKDVMISINPLTYSEGIFSWFPMYIPIREPVFLRKGEEMSAYFWRYFDSKKVWYEWTISLGRGLVPLHNVNGNNFPINLMI